MKKPIYSKELQEYLNYLEFLKVEALPEIPSKMQINCKGCKHENKNCYFVQLFEKTIKYISTKDKELVWKLKCPFKPYQK